MFIMHLCYTTKKSAYRGNFEKLKTASIDYQTGLIDTWMLSRGGYRGGLKTASKNFKSTFVITALIDMNAL